MTRNIKAVSLNIAFPYQQLEQGEYNMVRTFVFYILKLATKVLVLVAQETVCDYRKTEQADFYNNIICQKTNLHNVRIHEYDIPTEISRPLIGCVDTNWDWLSSTWIVTEPCGPAGEV
jgi:hypothetical protein